MAAGSVSLVAVLRDARNPSRRAPQVEHARVRMTCALLRTRIPTSETQYWRELSLRGARRVYNERRCPALRGTHALDRSHGAAIGFFLPGRMRRCPGRAMVRPLQHRQQRLQLLLIPAMHGCDIWGRRNMLSEPTSSAQQARLESPLVLACPGHPRLGRGERRGCAGQAPGSSPSRTRVQTKRGSKRR